MDIIEFRDYVLSLPLTEETTPFDENTLVYKVGGKMYTMIDIVDPTSINVKCDPARAIELREQYVEITPGFHMNKVHWNTIELNGDLRDDFIREMIRDSYMLVVQAMPKAKREEILKLQNK